MDIQVSFALSSDSSFKLQDDAALLDISAYKNLIITQDTIQENVHFLPSCPLDRVAKKALRVNLSDAIAKGGKSLYYSLSLGIPSGWRESDIDLFTSGLRSDQEHFGLELTGGDTYISRGGLCVSITLLAVPHKNYVSRSGAKAGDILCVSGPIGDASLGLRVSKGELMTTDDQHFIDHYQCPEFQDISAYISEHATSALDISDGLAGDIRKLCKASGVGIELEVTDIPLSDATNRVLSQDSSLLDTILSGGDDYHIAFTLPPDCQQIPNSVVIGEVVESSNSSLLLKRSGSIHELSSESYIHNLGQDNE